MTKTEVEETENLYLYTYLFHQLKHEAFFQVGGPMNKILVLRNKGVFKGLFIHLIGCEQDQDLGPPFSHVFKQVGHWSTYLEKMPVTMMKCH